MVISRLGLLGITASAILGLGLSLAARVIEPQERDRCEKLFAAGNFKDAFEGYRRLALNPKTEFDRVGGDLRQAVQCLIHLGRNEEVDSFRESVIAVHAANWRLLEAAAQSYLLDDQHFGMIVAGKFHRGRLQGRFANSFDRDRVRALELLVQGMARARSDADRAAAGRFMVTLAQTVLGDRAARDSWRLQSLTALDQLPDYGDSPFTFWNAGTAAAPVDSGGSPVYYTVPESFEKAKNDGQRWRWALEQAALLDPALRNQTRKALADFLLGQFGTQTIAGHDFDMTAAETSPKASGPYAFDTLEETETIARLASGIKRFTLPDEFNPIKIYQAIADDPKTGEGEHALGALASIFENRRQLDRAADYFKRSRELFGDPDDGKQHHIDQIKGNWGRFESLETLPAGRGATVDFRFRNGNKVHFEAREILFTKLLKDVKDYISAAPGQLEWNMIDLSNIGMKLVGSNELRYLGRSVAQWDLDLLPLPAHFDKRITVTTPLQNAGAYLLTAQMEDGNSSRVVVWLDDTVIVKKPLEGKFHYYIADARTGHPVRGARVDFFGFRSLQVAGRNEWRVETKSLSHQSDDDGQFQVPTSELVDPRGQHFQWVTTAATPEGRLAHLGFANIWNFGQRDSAYDQVKVFTITDRPVYRPGAPVRFKFWVARARFDQPDAADFAGQPFDVEIHNPKGEKIFTKRLTADRFGGFDGSLELPSDAALGVYQVYVPKRGGGTFRVEEYKKPEFEVSVAAPTVPVMLGEKVPATIKANYYFGGPVAQAKVKYKITRTTADARWYPAASWDWLYGSGYWWFAADSSWYPGWSHWGMYRPIAPWWGLPNAPPEVVAEAELPIRPDGTLPLEIDTALAKASHPDDDHRYEITAEITDQSRRTIVGTGTVLVARKPFSVFTWVDRGHYKAGDAIEAGLSAQTLDRKPVTGKGTLKLMKITYDAERKPVETPVESWDVALGADGQARQVLKAAAPGQYRLSATINDGQGHQIDGGYLLTITGEGFTGASFRYNDLEIIPERKEYRPGETLRLLINTNQINSTVLLFVRPSDGIYLPPKVVHLQGKSTIEEIGIVPRDMPNIFVEALTVADGKIHDETREIAIPPESRIAQVAIEPSQTVYKPGQKAKVKLKLTGPLGKPFVGSTVVAVYDKSVEYISGGSNVPEIKAYFWSWKRHHHPQTESSLGRWSGNVTKQDEIAMQDLGALGGFQMGSGGWAYGGMGGMGGGGAQFRDGSARFMSKLAAAPAAMAPGAPGPSGAAELSGGEKSKSPILDAPPAVQPTIRTNFADTAFWAAALVTDSDGAAAVDFPLPDSLTTWKVKVWTLGPGTTVGQAESEVVTSKDLLVRLQAPRFFVEKDEVVLSANVHNKLKNAKSVQVVLELEGSVLQPLGESTQTVQIAAGSEQRVDWRVKVVHEGQAVIRMKALTDEESDAAQMSFPAFVHGMLKMEAFAGALRPDEQKGQVIVRVPSERKPDQSRLEVHYSPTLAGALVDALPYLADYPYGCTEQTLNRFLPTVITQKILINLGLDLKAIKEKHTNLNAQQLGDARDRAKPPPGQPHNAVFDQAEDVKMAASGIERLSDMQLSDGGWGWFSGYGEFASPHTTALVVHGLQLARQNDVALKEGMLEKGVASGSRATRTIRRHCSKTQPARSSRTNGRPTRSTLWSSWSWPIQTFATIG